MAKIQSLLSFYKNLPDFFFTVVAVDDVWCDIPKKDKKTPELEAPELSNKYGGYLLSRMIVQYHRP